jgi:hypothetical protein
MSIDILPTPSQPDLPSLSAVIFKFLLIHNIDAHPPSAPSTDLVRSSTQKTKINKQNFKKRRCFSDELELSLHCSRPARRGMGCLYIHRFWPRASGSYVFADRTSTKRKKKNRDKCKMQNATAGLCTG